MLALVSHQIITVVYEIEVSILFINSSSATTMPRIQIAKSTGGTVTIQPQQHALVPVTNATNGKLATTSARCILQLNANDLVRFVLSACSGSLTAFTTTLNTSVHSTSNLSISVRYLGNYTLTTS